MAMGNVIITSHGFGVGHDSAGFFTELAERTTDARFILFDYNETLPNGDVIVPSLYDQAKLLEMAVDQTDSEHITIVAHSQGCIVASLAKLSDKVKHVILLAPPIQVSSKDIETKLKERLGEHTSLEKGISLSRIGGGTMYFTKGYVESINEVQPLTLYETLARHVPTVVVRATQDELLGYTDFQQAPIEIIDIEANHNFTTSGARLQIKTIIEKTLS